MSKRFPIAMAAALILAFNVAPIGARAQDSEADHPPMDAPPPFDHRMTPEDRAAFLDARIAAVHAGLKLTPDQEKLWPAAESAIRDALTQMRQARQKIKEDARGTDRQDPIARMRRGAERSMLVAQSLTKIADAAQPLYASLTDDQKWRLSAMLKAIHWGREQGRPPPPDDRDGD
jgi:zinc resistance-associated protein